MSSNSLNGGPTRRQLLWAAGGIAALAFLIIVICGCVFGWKWTGLHKRTFWDWLDLLIVPTAIAVATFVLNRIAANRQQVAQEAQKERDEAAQQGC
jgi:hypothetical protein